MPHDPPVTGVWTGAFRTPGDTFALDDGEGCYPVHMILLHTGRVLIFSGGWESSELLHRSWTFDPATWDPADPTVGVEGRWFLPEFDDDPIANPPPPTVTDDEDIDLFCAHHVQIESGHVMVIGGDGPPGGFGNVHSNDSIHFYDPVAERWDRIPDEMVDGRWYPTGVLQPDGSVVVFSGDGTSGLVAETEILSPPDYTPQELSGGRRRIDGSVVAQYMYPGMFLIPGGVMYYVPTAFAYGNESDFSNVEDNLGDTMSFRVTDPAADPPVGVWDDHGVRPASMMRQEGTAVLLSPAEKGQIALIGGGWVDDSGEQQGANASVEILDTGGGSPTWELAGEMHRSRANVNAVLLPDGKVLIFGGTGGYKWEDDPAEDERRFTAELWDPTVPFDPANPSAAFTETGEMHRSRMYHSGGLLLPDGRVLVGGGEDRLGPNADGLGPQPGERVPRTGRPDTSQRTMEFYEPPYLHDGPQPTIDDIGETGGPDSEIHYGGSFTIFTEATDIEMMALMRPGSCTHHTDTEQRHVPLAHWRVEDGYRARVVSDAAVAPPGYYMVWIVDEEGRPCERAKFVRLSRRFCRIITDRSRFSIHEVEATGSPASFGHAVYVVVEGYRPEELDITTSDPSSIQLDGWAPSLRILDAATGSEVAGMDAYVMDMHLEVSDISAVQRITFEYGIRFTDTSMFPAEGVGDERRPLRVSGGIEGHTCVGALGLFRQPNPYMRDGSTHWLSTDLRVFQIRPGESQSGIPLTTGTSAESYLREFLSECDTAPESAGHPFRQISEDQEESRLELSPTVDGDPVYNFAVARVRYRSEAAEAPDVRVFFRAFTTAATTLEYRDLTYPRDDATNLPTVGADATDVLTLPFFSVDRGMVAVTGDPENVKTLPSSGAGGETRRYFGARLDINDTTPVITDPGGETRSVQDLVRGKHQCLVAEIRFGPDEIPTGLTPANSENLSQRNLAIVESDNPGSDTSHTVAHTFELETTYAPKRVEQQALVAFEGRFGVGPRSDDGFDELMIFWGGLPDDTTAMLHLPALSADDILAASALRYEGGSLEKVDNDTIRFSVGDVSFIPLPADSPRRVAGLLTVELPDDVSAGQEFRVVVRHHSKQQGRIVGTFELVIPVSHAPDILPAEARLLAVLRSIATGIRPPSRWFPVFQRYLAVTGGRVRGLGGDPAAIGPSAEGHVPADALPPALRPGRNGTPIEECCEEVGRGLRWIALLLGIAALLLLLLIYLTLVSA